MDFNADLHIHGQYSRATSNNMNIRTLAVESGKKGISLLATGDCLHPKWLEQIKECERVDEGTFEMAGTRFILSTEVQAAKRVHHLIYFPSISAVEGFQEGLKGHTKSLEADGRPYVQLDGEELAELSREVDASIGPAHAFTPWTGMYAHYASLKECYGSRSGDVRFLELGLSADSSYGDMIRELENITFMTNSDAHSPYAIRLAREFNTIRAKDMTYSEVMMAVRRERGRKFVRNVGLPPQEGKYNETACPRCFEHYTLEEALSRRWRCSCRGVIKKGVRDRARELSDDGVVRHPDHRPEYIHLVPLGEIINQVMGVSSPYSKKGMVVWEKLITAFGNEVKVLLEADISTIGELVGKDMAEGVEAFRTGKVIIVPGGGGQYGKVLLPSRAGETGPGKPSKRKDGQMTLTDKYGEV